MAGIFISRGITPIIKAGDLKITLNENGAHDMDVTLSLKFDVCSIWLKISVDHLVQAKEWALKCQEAFKEDSNVLKSETLEKEFEHSMQAVISMAIAYDAFYASLKGKVYIFKNLTDTWKRNRTARHIQVSETIRQGFKIKNNGAKILAQSIKEIYRFRDMAIHPRSDIEQAIMRTELGVGVEWRYACFTYSHSKLIVNEGLKRLKELFSSAGYKNEKLKSYCSSMLTLIEPMIHTYEQNIDKIK
jgi:hypothetical protein